MDKHHRRLCGHHAAGSDSSAIGPVRIGLIGLGMVGLTSCGGGGSAGGGSSVGTSTGLGLPLQVNPATFENSEYRRNNINEGINASSGYATGGTGNGMRVAVIDTGIDTSHDQLSGALAAASTDIVGGRSDLDDVDGHGTAVAGVVAAARDGVGVHGVAFDAELLAIRADTPNTCPAACSFNQGTLATATDYAVANGADIINYSLGAASSLSASYRLAMEDAVTAGRIVVLAAGNGGAANPDLPGAFAATSGAGGQAIVVGSVNASNVISSFSNRAGSARDVFLVAPGESIRSTALGGGITTLSGTSFATPAVSGAAAVVWSAAPHLSAAQVVSLLLSTATDLGTAGTDAVYGRGLLNLDAAIQPQGSVIVPTGATVGAGGPAAVSTQMALAPAFAAGAGAGTRMMVLDAYDRAYEIGLDDLMGKADRGADPSLWLDASDRVERRVDLLDGKLSFAGQSARDGSLTGLDLSAELTPTTRLSLTAGTPTGQARLSGQDWSRPYASLVAGSGEAAQLALEHGLGGGWTLALGLAASGIDSTGETQPADRLDLSGGLARDLADGGKLAFELGQLEERQGPLGSTAEGALDLGNGSHTTHATLRLSQPLGPHTTLIAAAGLGLTRTEQAGDSLVTGLSDFVSTSFALGIEQRGIFGDDDRLSLTLAQPLRAEGGNIALDLPVARTLDGEVVRRRHHLALDGDGRELDLELTYSTQLDEDRSLQLGLLLQHEPGHDAQADPALAAAIRYIHRF